MNKKNKIGYYVDDYVFEYDGHKEKFDYELDNDDFDLAVEYYFSFRDLKLDGTNKAIFNFCSEVDIIDDIIDFSINMLREHCKDKAFEDYKDYVDFDLDEEDIF